MARLEPVSHGRLEGTDHALWDTLGDTPVPRVGTVPATGGSSAGRGRQTLELQGSEVSARSPCSSESLGGPSHKHCPGLGLAQSRSPGSAEHPAPFPGSREYHGLCTRLAGLTHTRIRSLVQGVRATVTRKAPTSESVSLPALTGVTAPRSPGPRPRKVAGRVKVPSRLPWRWGDDSGS